MLRSLQFYRLSSKNLLSFKTCHSFYSTKASSPLPQPSFRRFWKNTATKIQNGEVLIQLDGRNLKSPSGKIVKVPKEMELLAHLIALEWDRLPSTSVRQHNLPITSLVSRAIDISQFKKEEKELLSTQLIRFLDTDTILIYSPETEYEGKLLEEQKENWWPLKETFENKLGVQLSYLDGDAGIIAHKQTQETHERIRNWLSSLNSWQLAAFERSVSCCKSFIVSFMILKGYLNSEKAAALTNLELQYQTNRWGSLEDAHEIDNEDLKYKLASSAILSRCIEDMHDKSNEHAH
ncbi:Protein atp12, mitochondrial [Schizosaccharomyces pombe]